MKYEHLKKFILEEMKIPDNKNYQPVMIRHLNQNRGNATRLELQKALHDANPERSVKFFKNHIVFKVLTESHPVTKRNESEDSFSLLDYETFSPTQKAHITMYCDEKIRNSTNPIPPRIILFSVSGKASFEHFEKTILNDVDITKLSDTILKEFSAVRTWGSIPSNQAYSKWAKLKHGDILLFYKDKEYIASAILEGTEQNPVVAKEMWGVKPESDDTWELIMFMKPENIFSSKVSLEKLNELLDYLPNFMPTRTLDFTPVKIETIRKLENDYGTLQNALNSIGFSFNDEEQETSFNLEELIEKFDKNRNLFKSNHLEQKGESYKTREKFLKKFPIESILNLSLDDYVIGKQNEESFCHMLEHSLPVFGRISGRYASLHGVYWAKDDGGYKWRGKFANENDAFSSIKQQIHSMLMAAKTLEIDEDWEKFSDFMEGQEKTVYAHVKSKILCVYFPHIFIDLHKKELLNYILDTFKVENKISEPRYILQKRVLDIKNNHKIMKNWDYTDFGHFGFNVIKNRYEETDESDDEPYENYYIITQNEGSGYDDIHGVQYGYNSDVHNYKNFLQDTNFIIQKEIDKKNFFVGYGKVGEIISKPPRIKENGRNVVDKIAKFSEYKEFPEKKIRTEETNNKMLDFAFPSGKRNIPPAMLPITKDFFNEIINDEVKSVVVPEKTFVDSPLIFPKDNLDSIKKEIENELLIDDHVIEQIISSLYSGKNILLTGPVGTGKTHLAQLIPKLAWKEIGGYYPYTVTATSDWTTQDVIGGIFPKIDNNKIRYLIQKGCVAETVSENWENKESPLKKRSKRTIDGHEYNGVWLVIDEFNRANIDKAFGQLFTALEYKTLDVPTTDPKLSSEKLIIPEDYRIIGTLNTFDKHFLFRLSDALKRRFSFIEILPPSYSKKEEEIEFIAEKAIKGLREVQEELKIKSYDDIKKNTSLMSVLKNLYEIMAYVRLTKNLGTALLISIFRFILINYLITKDWDKSLDQGLITNLLPQLESLQYWQIDSIMNFVGGRIHELFRRFDLRNRPDVDRYEEELKTLTKYLKTSGKNKNAHNWNSKFKTGEIMRETNPISDLNPWNGVTRPNLKNFRKALEGLKQEKGFFETQELGEDSQ